MSYQGNWSQFLDLGLINIFPLKLRLQFMDWMTPLNYDLSRKKAFAALKLNSAGHLLDLGCGSGRLLIAAQNWLRNGGNITGVDLDPHGVDFAGNRARKLGVAGRVELLVKNISSIDCFPPESFDAAIAHFSLYILPSEAERKSVLSKVYRILKPAGRFSLVVPNSSYASGSLLADARELEEKRDDKSRWYKWLRQLLFVSEVQKIWRNIEKELACGTFHPYSEKELFSHLSEAGFQEIWIEPTYAGCAFLAAATK